MGNLSESINGRIFIDSLATYAENFSVSGAVMSILVIFMLAGLFDKLRGNKYGYGERFDAGFQAMGDLALAIVGIIAASPVLLRLLSPVVAPFYQWLGASPAMFPASLLALDMAATPWPSKWRKETRPSATTAA